MRDYYQHFRWIYFHFYLLKRGDKLLVYKLSDVSLCFRCNTKDFSELNAIITQCICYSSLHHPYPPITQLSLTITFGLFVTRDLLLLSLVVTQAPLDQTTAGWVLPSKAKQHQSCFICKPNKCNFNDI